MEERFWLAGAGWGEANFLLVCGEMFEMPVTLKHILINSKERIRRQTLKQITVLKTGASDSPTDYLN